MEMVSFDTTLKVFDYNTGEEIDLAKAFFRIDSKRSRTPVLAFSTKEGAEKFASETKDVDILDYTGLPDRKFSAFHFLPRNMQPQGSQQFPFSPES